MLSKLDLSKEVEEYEAHTETTEIKFGSCSHKNVSLTDGRVRCACGMAWTGHGVQELYQALKNQK